MASPERPRLFVGASKGGQHVAESLRAGLHEVAHVTAWCDGEPAPPAWAFDAAGFVLGHGPSHGVLLRLGVFLGTLGRERIVVCPAFDSVELPDELRELTVAAHPGAVREHLRSLAEPTVEETSGVARRRRRSLGTARSTHPEQTLRIVDISLTGALLETFGEIPEHLVLDFELDLGWHDRVFVAAEVVRIQYPQWGRVGGVGVRFIRFDHGSQTVLVNYLEWVGAETGFLL